MALPRCDTWPHAVKTPIRLHLVEHQQPVVAIAGGAQAAQIVPACCVDAAFALDRLQEDRHDVGVAAGHLFNGVEVVDRHPHETCDQWAEAIREARLPKLPHERDESGAGMTPAAPDSTIQQAYRDVQRGLQDTDRGPPAGKAYQKQK